MLLWNRRVSGRFFSVALSTNNSYHCLFRPFSENDIQYELQLEIERAKTLASKNQRQPTSASRPAAGFLSANQDPKHVQVIRFYEDLTNLIIPNIKMQPGRFLDMPEWILNCCYTYNDVTDKEAGSKSQSRASLCLYGLLTQL